MVRVRSRDGDIFELSQDVARVSPMLASLIEDGTQEDEDIPLPLVGTQALRRLLDQLQHYHLESRWDTRRLGAKADELEDLLWAADFLCLERLSGLCLAKLVSYLAPGSKSNAALIESPLVKEQTIEPKSHEHRATTSQTPVTPASSSSSCMPQVCKSPAAASSRTSTITSQISMRALRRSLEFRSLRLPEAVITAVLRELSVRASEGDACSLAAAAVCRSHTSEAVRLAAAACIGRLAPRGCQQASGWLQDALQAEKSIDVQQALLWAIAKVGGQGEKALSLLLSKLGSGNKARTRQAAVKALGAVATPGQPRAMAALIGCKPLYSGCGVEDSDSSVRLFSLEVMADLAHGSQTPRIIRTAAARLEDDDDKVRLAAMHAIRQIAGLGNKLAISAVAERLEHRFWWVAKAAVLTLSHIAERGDAAASSEAARRVGHSNAVTRRAALDALAEVASVGDNNTLEAIAANLDQTDANVRRTAVHALVKLGKGHSQALDLCVARIASGVVEVRNTAVEALGQLAILGDMATGHKILVHLTSSSAYVRHAALAALGMLKMPSNESRLVRAVSFRLLDKHPAVRASAQKLLLQGLAASGNSEVLRVLARSIRHTNSGRRRVAARTLIIMARPVPDSLLQMLRPALLHKDSSIRLIAADTLCQLAARGGASGTNMLAHCLEHRDFGIRNVALDVLPRFLKANSTQDRMVEFVLKACLSRLSDANSELRAAAVRCSAVLASVAGSSFPPEAVVKITELLATRLADSVRSVRHAAIESLRSAVCGKSQAWATKAAAATCSQLAHHNWLVRWAAAAVILGVRPGVHEAMPPNMMPVVFNTIQACAQRYSKHSSRSARDVANFLLTSLRSGSSGLCCMALAVESGECSFAAEAPCSPRHATQQKLPLKGVARKVAAVTSVARSRSTTMIPGAKRKIQSRSVDIAKRRKGSCNGATSATDDRRHFGKLQKINKLSPA
eukprot:TRINITY_DN45574_c0_g1_i1.p1 TRINITY_DN45574_c0_g1~~TRINITY_DN45574_c0_g1_i1.p1  ORF type:complete len:965 (+),score=141.31 TRINITY_DN45574_c0_g1_i1:58-2952(+)